MNADTLNYRVPESEAKSERRTSVLVAVAFAMALVVGGLVGFYYQARTAPTEATFSAAAPVQVAPIKITYSGEGTFAVPGQVKTGVYYVSTEDTCHLEILKNLSGKPSAIRAWKDVTRGTRYRISITKYDMAVLFSGTCFWQPW